MANRIRADLHQVELDIDEMLGEIARLRKENQKKDEEIDILKEEIRHLKKGKVEKSPERSSEKTKAETPSSPKGKNLVLSDSASTAHKKESLVPVFVEEVPVKLSQDKYLTVSTTQDARFKFYPEGDGKNPPVSPTHSSSNLHESFISTGPLSPKTLQGSTSQKRMNVFRVKEGKNDEFEDAIQNRFAESAFANTNAPPTNVLQFSTGATATTVFLDFALTKNIWRCDLRFYHDDAHSNESADFGVVNSSSINNFLDKWLYNSPETCVYLLDKTTARICVGKSPKPLMPEFNVRNGTEIAVEVDCDIRQIRFYNRVQPIPFSIRNPHKSVHVGVTGRWQQRLELISMRRVAAATLRGGVDYPVIDWTSK